MSNVRRLLINCIENGEYIWQSKIIVRYLKLHRMQTQHSTWVRAVYQGMKLPLYVHARYWFIILKSCPKDNVLPSLIENVKIPFMPLFSCFNHFIFQSIGLFVSNESHTCIFYSRILPFHCWIFFFEWLSLKQTIFFFNNSFCVKRDAEHLICTDLENQMVWNAKEK